MERFPKKETAVNSTGFMPNGYCLSVYFAPVAYGINGNGVRVVSDNIKDPVISNPDTVAAAFLKAFTVRRPRVPCKAGYFGNNFLMNPFLERVQIFFRGTRDQDLICLHCFLARRSFKLAFVPQPTRCARAAKYSENGRVFSWQRFSTTAKSMRSQRSLRFSSNRARKLSRVVWGSDSKAVQKTTAVAC